MDFEAKLQIFYESVLKSGMNAIDVGAHVGRHCFEMVRLVGNTGNIYAYEPIPSMYQSLKTLSEERSDLRDVLKVYPYAISNSEGVIDFCLAVDAPWFSGILERAYDSPTRVEHISVDSRELDKLIDLNTPISYIKIDTEGAEWNVIQGAVELIKRWRPHVSFEFGENSYKNYNVNPDDVFDFFGEINYILFDINGKKLSKQDFSTSSVQQSVWDYITSPEEKSNATFAILTEQNIGAKP